MQANILIVDDDRNELRYLCEILQNKGYLVRAVHSSNTVIAVAQAKTPDIILLDICMPGITGYELCKQLKKDESLQDIPVIFISALDGTIDKTHAFSCGGVDYIIKPFAAEEVLVRVETHLKIYHLTTKLKRTIKELEQANTEKKKVKEDLQKVDNQLSIISEDEAKRWGISSFISKSPTMAKILDDIRKLQSVNTNILILGESGTGKELVARAIHFGGSRFSKSFVPVNCCAIPDDLFESICFGYVKGAFTGAIENRKGLFECADGGTLFLDEIGDMSLLLQAKLLRFLEDGELMPVGSAKPSKINCRIIAATNCDLAEKVAQGNFRSDLYFRLAGFAIHLPSLRNRKEDVQLLTSHFLQIFAREMRREEPNISKEALAALQSYSYPGNVRELKNIIESAMIRCGSSIYQEHLNFITSGTKEKTSTVTSENLRPAEKAIIEYLRINGSINNEQCRGLLESGLQQSSYWLKKMYRKGILKRDGERRWAIYYLSS